MIEILRQDAAATFKPASWDLIEQFHQELMLPAAGNFSPLTFNSLPGMNAEKSSLGRAA